MKKMKKFFAMFLALAMVLGMSVTTFAAELPKPDNKATGTVVGVESGATVTAYQIVKAKYNKNGDVEEGFAGYELVRAGSIAGTDFVPDNAEISELAANTDGLPSRPMTESTDSDGKVIYTADLEAGYWMVLVNNTNTTNYNPMLLGIYYTNTADGTVLAPDPGEDFEVDADADYVLNNQTVYAKSSEVTVTKTANKTTDRVGETVTYTLAGTIPSYSAEYTTNSLTYIMRDSIVSGLSYVGNVKVTAATETGLTYTVHYYSDKEGTAEIISGAEAEKAASAKSFSVEFGGAYIHSLASLPEAQRSVTVTYDAKITAEAITAKGENDVTLSYSNDPQTPASNGETGDKVYTYTFAVKGGFKKTGENNAVLPGAEFTVYDGDQAIQIVKSDGTTANVATSETETGEIYIGGLAGDKTYTMKETKAPDGYTLNGTVYTISFPEEKRTTKTVDGKTVIDTYTVAISYTDAAEDKTVTNETVLRYGDTGTLDFQSGTVTTIVNTKLTSLPSTGGIGTTIFTVGGCAIMIIAAGLYFSLRRRTVK